MATHSIHMGPEWMRNAASQRNSQPLATTPTGLGPNRPANDATINGNAAKMSYNSSSAERGGGGGRGNLVSSTTLSTPSTTHSISTAPTPAVPYSSLLNPTVTQPPTKLHQMSSPDVDPFRYSRDQLVNIWKNAPNGWPLGIEVERYEGVVVDYDVQPASAREMSESEIKLYAMSSLNSRRPSISHTHSDHKRGDSDFPRRGAALNTDTGDGGPGITGRRGLGDISVQMGGSNKGFAFGSSPVSPLRERFNRRDSGNTPGIGTSLGFRARGLSGSNPTDGSTSSPRTPGSFNFGTGGGFGGVLGAGEGWGGRRRPGTDHSRGTSYRNDKIQETEEIQGINTDNSTDMHQRSLENKVPQDQPMDKSDEGKGGDTSLENWEDDSDISDPKPEAVNGAASANEASPPRPPQHPPNDLSQVTWKYYDDNNVLQGPFTSIQLKSWYQSKWLRQTLLMTRPDYDTIFYTLDEFQELTTAKGAAPEDAFLTWIEPIHEPIKPEAPVDLPPGLVMPPVEELTHPPSVFATALRSNNSSGIGVLSSRLNRAVNDSTGNIHHSPSSIALPPRVPHRSGTIDTVSNTGTESPISINASVNGSLGGGSGTGSGLYTHSGPKLNGGGRFFQNSSPYTNNSLLQYGQNVNSSLLQAPHLGPTSLGRIGVSTPDAISPMDLNAPGYGFDNNARYQSPLAYGSSPGWSNNSPYRQGTGTFGSIGRSGETLSDTPGGPNGELYDSHFSQRAVDPIGLGFGDSLPRTANLGQSGYGFNTSPPQGHYANQFQQHDSFPPVYQQPPRFGNISQQLRQQPSVEFQKQINALPHNALQAVTHSPSSINIPPIQSGQEQTQKPTDFRDSLPDALNQELIPITLPNFPSSSSEHKAQSPVVIKNEISKAPTEKAVSLKAESPIEQAQQISPVKTEPVEQATVENIPQPMPAPAVVEDESDQPFIPVKHRKTSAAVAAQPSPAVAPTNKPAIVNANNSGAAPTLGTITVPLTSLITPSAQSPAATAPTRPVWGNVASSKDEPTLSLKEIQEAETKRAKELASQKATKASTATVSTPTATKDEEAGTSLMTWGLPTSLAGAKGSTPAATPAAAVAKESPATVWSTGVRAGAAATPANVPPKKTMKEIQEEEERKRKKEKEAATAAKRIAETKASTPAVQATPLANGVWTTVGPGGKSASTSAASPATRPLTGLAALPPRPSAAAIASGNANARPQPTTVPSQRSVQPVSAVKYSAATSSSASTSRASPALVIRDESATVSPETMKWMRDSLQKGLKPGSSVEDIIVMLLSIQDEEFIADTIYQSSEIMDGRRFASELLARRKTDAAGVKPTNSGGNSMADIVKAPPPKPQTAPDFKVVKKKGRKA